eukprot:TRINITY_DN11658_c0_g1_i1.p1 TRINITY_DN11658_c0_g1~~TRINITY_DN11658_c0_g1_i1.p1  ORF type:complete len:297 (-),score=97.49 TRINITY_DN11658_c0_g1_i1:189-1079(-)
MDFVQGKRREAAAAREAAAQKRRESEAKESQANEKRTESTTYIEKARHAQNHAEELKLLFLSNLQERASGEERIRNYQRQISGCNVDIHDSEAAITQIKGKITTIKASILRRRAEAEMLKKEVEKLRREADSHCMPGLHLRETGNNARAKVLLETAEAKQREAMAKMKQSEDEERMASDETRNMKRLGDALLVHGRHRAEDMTTKEQEERRVAKMSETLTRLKREVEQSETVAKDMRETASQLMRDCKRIAGEGERLEQQARAAEMEANKLEAEAAAAGQGAGAGTGGATGGLSWS